MPKDIDSSKPSDLILALAKAAVQEIETELGDRQLGWDECDAGPREDLKAALGAIIARYIEMVR